MFKLSFPQFVYGFVRYLLIFTLVVGLFNFHYSTYTYAKTDDEKVDKSKSMNTSVYEQLRSGHKLIQEQEYKVPEQPTVYLTFDDGPSKLTPKVLDILKKENIQATFFVCGDQLQDREDTIKRMVEEGHTIGNHSFNHEYSQLYSKGFSGFWEQIQRNEDRLEQITGSRPALIRAPGGTGTNFDAFYFYYLDQAGYSVYDWDVDSKDSRRKGVPASEIIASVKKSPLKHELTVLLHDGAGHEQSVVALPEIIRFYKEQGYVFAPITTDVKPTQFKVSSKLKWNRSMSKEQFQQQLIQSQLYATTKNNRVHESTLVAFINNEPVGRKGNNLIDDMKSNNMKSNDMKSNDMKRDDVKGNNIDMNSQLKVPLRSLAESMGAIVTWNESEQSVLIRLGTTSILYTNSNQKAEVFQLGQSVALYDLVDVERIDDRYYVSRRSMMKLLNYAVDNTNQQYFPGKVDQLSSRKTIDLYKW